MDVLGHLCIHPEQKKDSDLQYSVVQGSLSIVWLNNYEIKMCNRDCGKSRLQIDLKNLRYIWLNWLMFQK